MPHISEKNTEIGVYGALKQAGDRSVLVNGDLTSASAAKAAITTDAQKLHVAEKDRIQRQSHAGIDNAEQFLSGYNSGSTLTNYNNLSADAKFEGRQLVP